MCWRVTVIVLKIYLRGASGRRGNGFGSRVRGR
jgi:hypothetical protein